MTPRYTVSPRAHIDMDGIAAYLEEKSPGLSSRFYDDVRATFERLAQFPHIGRGRNFRGRDLRAARSWTMDTFSDVLVVYQPSDEGARILRVMHGARDLDSELGH